MENLFDTLCSALLEPEIKRLFHEAEGVDLMLIMMKYVPISSLMLLIYLPPSSRDAEKNSPQGVVPSRCLTTPSLGHQGRRIARHSS